MLLRGMEVNEKDILRDFLYEAIFIPEGVKPPDRSIIEQPELRIYYEDFGTGRADHCIVADDNGKVIGAVWTRIMNDYGPQIYGLLEQYGAGKEIHIFRSREDANKYLESI